ncbi:MAG: hypothetical protein ACHRHE_21020 [Tepidisphaerales bacterium]
MSKAFPELLIAFILSCWCGGCMGQSPFLHGAIERIEESGGGVDWHWSPEGIFFDLGHHPARLGDQDVSRLMPTFRQFDQLKILDFTGTPITNASLREIATLNTLERVYLAATKITPDGLLELKKLPKLWYVTVPSERFTEDDVRSLQNQMPGVTIKRQKDPGEAP